MRCLPLVGSPRPSGIELPVLGVSRLFAIDRMAAATCWAVGQRLVPASGDGRGDGAGRPGAGSSEGGLVFTGVQDEGLIELAGHGGQPPYYAKIQRHAGGQGFESPELRWSETQLESPGAEYSSEAQQRGGTMYFPVSRIGLS